MTILCVIKKMFRYFGFCILVIITLIYAYNEYVLPNCLNNINTQRKWSLIIAPINYNLKESNINYGNDHNNVMFSRRSLPLALIELNAVDLLN